MSILPKKVLNTLFLIRGLNLKDGLKLLIKIIYLFREFFITVKITPIISRFKVIIYRKDKYLLSHTFFDTKEINDFLSDIMKLQCDINNSDL